VRQVEFTEGVSAREDDSLHAWRIQFTLAEKLSNSERVETRRPGNPVKQQSAPGQAVTGEGEQLVELTGFERVLKRLDEALE